MKVLALESECYSKSFGILLFVVDAGLPNDYLCFSLDSRHRGLVPKKEFEAIMAGLMTDVSYFNISVEIDPEKPITLGVGWLGNNFVKESTAIGLPVPDLPKILHKIKRKGIFWFEDSKVLYRRMKKWIHLAAMRVFKEKDTKIAKLMDWVLPDDYLTLSARWYLKKTKAEKDKEIDFQLRTFFKGKKKKRNLVTEHNKLISLYLNAPHTIYL